MMRPSELSSSVCSNASGRRSRAFSTPMPCHVWQRRRRSPPRERGRSWMHVMRGPVTGLCAIAAVLTLASCEREQRQFRTPPAASEKAEAVRLSELQPGPSVPAPPTKASYSESAYAISQGQRLFQWFNCVGCHFHGGGGIGPP